MDFRIETYLKTSMSQLIIEILVNREILYVNIGAKYIDRYKIYKQRIRKNWDI